MSRSSAKTFGESISLVLQLSLAGAVLINGLEREIIGVFPAELQFGRNPDVLLPLSEIANEPWMRKPGQSPGVLGYRPAETWCDDVAGDERSERNRDRPREKISSNKHGPASDNAAIV